MSEDKWLNQVRADVANTRLVQIGRGPDLKDKMKGFLVGMSEHFFLVHQLSDDIYLNGYLVIPIDHIRRYRILRDWKGFAGRALKIRRQSPVRQKSIDLTDWGTLFKSANNRFPLITIHREEMDDTVCFIGQVKHLTEKTVTLREIDAAACWTRTRRYRFTDITRQEPIQSESWFPR